MNKNNNNVFMPMPIIKPEDSSDLITIKQEDLNNSVLIEEEHLSDSIAIKEENFSDPITIKVEPCSSTHAIIKNESITLPDFVKNEPFINCSSSDDYSGSEGQSDSTSPTAKKTIVRKKVMRSQVKKGFLCKC